MAALTTMLLTLPASAAQNDGTQEDGAQQTAAASEGPTTVPAFVVPYMAAGNGASTVVSITNLGGTACATSVDWKIGAGGVACRTFLTLGGGSPIGDELDHCTNPTAVRCNSTCPQPAPFGFSAEGAAIVGVEPHCRNKIAVDARIYYLDSNLDVAGASTPPSTDVIE